MTSTICSTTTTYSLQVPFNSVAYLQVELPSGLTDQQVLERITFQDTRDVEIDMKAIRCSVADVVTEQAADIVIERE